MRQRHFLKLHSNLALGATLAELPRPRLKTVFGWNQAALRAVRAARAEPLATARTLALLHTAMYNAWAAYDDDARQTAQGVAVRLPRAERSAASKASAMSHAAWQVLAARFPPRRVCFDAQLAGLGLDPAARPGPLTPAGIGRSQALAVLESAGGNDAALPAPAAAERHIGIVRACLLAAHVSQRDGHGDDEDARLCFALADALAGALAASTGPAHAGAAAAEVLRRFTGSDRAGAGLRRTSFSGVLAAPDAAAGLLGREIGALAFDRASRYWQGKL